MSAFHKALENVHRVPLFEVLIYCSGTGTWGEGSQERFHLDGSCGGRHHEDDLLGCPTKWDAVKNAQEAGWTWDKNGNWLCPECSKEGGAG